MLVPMSGIKGLEGKVLHRAYEENMKELTQYTREFPSRTSLSQRGVNE